MSVRAVAAEVEVLASGPCSDGPVFHRAATTTAVAGDETVFDGHYPGFPIFPGVCLVESVHRSCAAAGPPCPARLAAVETAQFLAPVFPGDRLSVDLEWRAAPDDAWQCRAVVATASGPVARIRLRYEPGAPA